MTNLRDDLAEVVRLMADGYAYDHQARKAWDLIRAHAAEIERNARDALRHENERRDALLAIMALVDSVGGRVEIGCSSILRANHLRLVRERNPETRAEIFRTVPDTDTAMREGGGE